MSKKIETTHGDNIIDMFTNKSKDKSFEQMAKEDDIEEGETFADIVARNMANKERIARERKNANKSVLRSYRIKN